MRGDLGLPTVGGRMHRGVRPGIEMIFCWDLSRCPKRPSDADKKNLKASCRIYTKMHYICKRCGHETSHLGHFKVHLNKKKQCEPLYADVDRGTLLQELASCKGAFVVNEKIVKLEDIEDKEEFVRKIQEDNIKLKHENIKLQNENAKLKMGGGSVTNNNINITNIHVNNFLQEDTSYITDEYLKEILVRVYDSVPNVIKAIHFNPEHPENHNVRMPNKRDKYMVVRRSNEWRHEKRKSVLKSLVNKGYGFLANRCESLVEKMDSLQRHTFDRLMIDLDYALENGENGEVHSDMCERVEKMILDLKENSAANLEEAESTHPAN